MHTHTHIKLGKGQRTILYQTLHGCCKNHNRLRRVLTIVRAGVAKIP